jgi:hypothetical protein
MRLTEYLAEAVANRKTGKYRIDTSLIEKISEFSGYGDIEKALSECARFAGSIDPSNPNTIDGVSLYKILRRESRVNDTAYITGKQRTGSFTWPVIYVCNSKGRMAKITFGSEDFILGVDIFEWNGVSYAPIDSYDGRVIGGGVDEVKKLIYDSTK